MCLWETPGTTVLTASQARGHARCSSVTVPGTAQSLGFKEAPVCKAVLNLKLREAKEDPVIELKPESGLVAELGQDPADTDSVGVCWEH